MAAEQEVFKIVTTGAENDLEMVSRIARSMVGRARRLVRENRDKLDRIVAQLLARDSLDEPEIYAAAGIARPAVTPAPAPLPA
jgi:cell division protease FtsH